jgi:hypothetical protein
MDWICLLVLILLQLEFDKSNFDELVVFNYFLVAGNRMIDLAIQRQGKNHVLLLRMWCMDSAARKHIQFSVMTTRCCYFV